MSADHGSPPIPPEPKTPLWLTALGAGLFFAAGVWWLASQPAAAAAPGVDAGAATVGDAAAPGSPAH
jgi:hypothetical protein